MKKLTLLVVFVSIVFTGLQCEKDDDGLFGNSDNNNKNDKNQNEEPTLPPATQSGKGTFGCKVNGEVWVPEAPPNINELHADYYKDEFFITAQRSFKEKDKQETLINIQLNKGFKGKGEYKLKTLRSGKYALYDLETICDYRTDSVYTGKMIITHFDSVKRIVSGKFDFKVVKRSCDPDTVAITEGRFDIKKGY